MPVGPFVQTDTVHHNVAIVPLSSLAVSHWKVAVDQLVEQVLQRVLRVVERPVLKEPTVLLERRWLVALVLGCRLHKGRLQAAHKGRLQAATQHQRNKPTTL